MRIVTSIFLIIVISLVSFQEAAFYAFFKLNQDYFATYLCVEKDIKESKCKGHCQLTKMLVENKEVPSSEIPLPSFERSKIELFLCAITLHFNTDESAISPCFTLTVFDDSSYSDPIFHPPIS